MTNLVTILTWIKLKGTASLFHWPRADGRAGGSPLLTQFLHPARYSRERMNGTYLIGAILAGGLFVYLLVALLKPEILE